MADDQKLASLLERVQKHAEKHEGKIYTAVPHPAFASFKVRHGPERFDIIAPHLEYQGGTLLDIGSHWGYMAHRLEDLGYKVTAVENAASNARFMTDIRDLCGKKFEIINASIFDVENLTYDVVLALNILHHFLRTEERYVQFEKMLDRMKCKMMIVQPQDHTRKMMIGAYRNMPSEEFVRFLQERLSLPNAKLLGKYHGRDIYKLTK